MSKQAETLTAAALVALVGCSNSTLSRWVGAGLPHSREKTGHGGARRLLFKREDALRWIVENASLSSAQLAKALTAQASPKAAPEPTTGTLDANAAEDEGLLPCLERLRKTERESFALLHRLKRSGEIAGVRVVGERYVNECRALVALERAAVDFQARRGELVNAAEARAVYMKVVTGIKNNLLGVPSSAIPLIMPYMNNPDCATTVHKIIDDKIRDALRAIEKVKA